MTTNLETNLVEPDVALIHPDCDKKLKSVQSKIIHEKETAKTTIKDGKGFLFDAIIVRLDIPNMTINETTNLVVDVEFNGRDFSISSSRINILDFIPERNIEFVANPLELKEQLLKNPLRLKVTNAGNVVGYGKHDWPPDFLSGLIYCDGEMKNSFEIELMKCDGIRTGTVQLIVRLQPKCEEYLEDISPAAICRNAHKEINPSDVLIVVDDNKKSCCCSQIGIIPASDSDQDLQPKCLDLSNFRALNSQTVDNMNILASLDPACQNLKKISNHYQKLIDAVKTNKRENLHFKESHMKYDEHEMFYTLPSDNRLKSKVFASDSDSCRMPITCPPLDYENFAAKHLIQMALAENPPELIENRPKALRCCPFCKENMTYLPKLAACPNCCYKPIPIFEEKPYDVSKSAKEILKEGHNKLETDDDSACDTNVEDRPKGRCTCKLGLNKPCAHCRIRKLCETLTNPTDIHEPKSLSIHCASSSDSRPLLTKMFSELKDLYDIEQTKEVKLQKIEKCEKELDKEITKKVNRKVTKETSVKAEEQKAKNTKVEVNNKKQRNRKRRKRSVKPSANLALKSRLYDYQLVRENAAPQIGHKTCINSFAGLKNVPANMGWLWNINNTNKWKPGAIRKPIKELMSYFLKDFPADTILVSQYCYRKKSKSQDMSDTSTKTLTQKPTLHVHKKNGEYIITMRPLKALEVLQTDIADPYENMKPIQFRIVKNPRLETMRNLKKCLKSMGFKKCICHKPITYCYCRSFVEKQKLEFQCNEECCKRQLEPCCDTLILSDTSDSEAEFDFGVTPPVGIIKAEKLKKVNFVNVSTQYNESDWNVVPLFPRPPNKYMKLYQCAVKDRKAKPVTLGKVTYAEGSRACGDGLLHTKHAKAIDFSAKYGERGDSESTGKTSKKKVNMLKYVMKMNRKMSKISPRAAAAKRKEKMELLKGVSPPILCMIDRRGKAVDSCSPCDPCSSCVPCNDARIC